MMMKRFALFLFSALLLISCDKEEDITDTRSCVEQMKERFKNDLKCSKQGAMEVNLFSAAYKNQRIYFPITICPSCNTVAPQFGYTCGNKKVIIDDFQDIGELKLVYNSCTEEFSE